MIRSTLYEEKVKSNFAVINVDFTKYRPDYAGYAILLGNNSWREFYQNKNFLAFSILGTISKIQLEIKCEGQSIIYKEVLLVSQNQRTYKFCLQDISKHANSFDKMTEIVFLLTPELHSSQQATFEISDMQIIDE